ncbi:MAG: hypothetical protein ACRDHO_14945, partial [Actinomycetota bacterium]
MRRTWSRLARLGLVSLAVPLLALQGNSPMPGSAEVPRAHVGGTTGSLGGTAAQLREAGELRY